MEIDYKWFAVYTRPRNEKKVANELTVRGIRNYCPLYTTTRQWSDRKKKVEVPLFSSYLFVQIREKQYYDVLNTQGVVKYISFEGKAVEIPEKQIQNIQLILDKLSEFEVSNSYFKKGEKVKVENGALTGLEGEIVRKDGQNLFLVRINNIAYSLLLKISEENLQKLN